MAFPFPYNLAGAPAADPDAIQGNFDALSKAFPLSRKSMQVEAVNKVADVNQPAFKNGWSNFGPASTWQVARFWKDPVGIVHIEGLVTGGTVSSSGVVFTLPAGYRPSSGLIFVTIANNAIGRITIAPTGDVIAETGSNVWFSLNCNFRQEQ